MADSEGYDCCDSSDHVTAGRQAVEQEWSAAWYEGDCKDANREVSKWLKEHIEKLTEGKTNCRILVPMCGATRDMQWLVDEGHEVIGLELVDKALHLFLDRHRVSYTTSQVPSVNDGKCYKSKDKKLTLYRCNIFDMDMSLVGKVDCVWDCGAMTDIPPVERKEYADILLSSLKPGGRIMAETFTFGEIEAVEEEQGHEDHAEGSICKHGVDHSNDPPSDCQKHDKGNDHSHDHSHDQHQGHEHLGEGHDEDFPCRPVEAEDFQKMYGHGQGNKNSHDDKDSGDEHHVEGDDEDDPYRPVEERDIQMMYGECCSIEMLCEEDNKEAEEWGPSWWAKNRLHLIIVK